MKNRPNLKYSLISIVFGILFVLLFQANRIQISQIPREPLKIDLGTEEARKYLLSGWSNNQRWGETTVVKAIKEASSLIAPLSFEETYRLTMKAFSVTPQGVPNQIIAIHFNDIALDSFEFKKSTEWQKFRINIPPRFIFKKTNTLKFVYSEDVSLSPVVFDYLKFKNYFGRIHKGLTLYLLYDPTKLAEEIYSPGNLFIRLFFYPPFPKGTFSFKVLGYSLVFLISFFLFSLFCTSFFSSRIKIELSKGLRLDLFTYLPSLILFSFFALISFFSPYNIVYSLKTFFILTIVPTIAFKTWFIYRASIIKTVKLIIKTILSVSKELWIVIKKTPLTVKFFPSNIKNFSKFLIKQHRENLSSAFILDFMLLLLLCALLSMLDNIITITFARWLAKVAYYLLLIGIIIKTVQFFRESRRGK